MHVRMKDLRPGDQAEIAGYDSRDHHYRRRLLAMGLTPGEVVTLRMVAPMGDPVELEIRGFQLSLRKVEAEILHLRQCTSHGNGRNGRHRHRRGHGNTNSHANCCSSR